MIGNIPTLIVSIFMLLPPITGYFVLNPSRNFPTHFDVYGRPDAWAQPNWYPLLWLFILLLTLLIWGARYVLPLRENIKKMEAAYNAFVLATSAFFSIYMSLSLLYSAEIITLQTLSSILIPCVGVLLIAAGAVIHSAKRNWIIGMRTPWGLESDEAWKESNKEAGVALIFSGTLLLAYPLSKDVLPVSLAVLIIGLLVAAAKAYLVWKREGNR